MQQIWQDVRAGAGLSEDTVALWCNISLLPVIAAYNKPAPAFNMTVRQYVQVYNNIIFYGSQMQLSCVTTRW